MNVDLETALPALTELLTAHLEAERDEPVRLPRDPDTLRAQLDLTLPERGVGFAQVVDELHAILRATPSTATPRFFNQLFGGRDGAAILGEALAAVLNNSMYTYKVAGIQVLIELELIRRMGAMVGYQDPEGVFCPGGSLSNLCGMALARDRVVPTLSERGSYGQTLRVYTSTESHYSIRKAAAILGIGRENVVRIPVDEHGAMQPPALRAAIDADQAAGYQPILINATSGTTVLGAFDPLPALADIAEDKGLWLHVDAAYGGSLLFHPDLRAHFEGIERADSVTWDAHKIMGVPLTCSVFLARKKGTLTQSLNETATYLFQDDTDDLNPGTRSLQCGRRNSALKLWTAWRTHGDEGYTERVTRLRDNTLYARDKVISHPELRLVREPVSLNLCFSVKSAPADALCTTLNEQGRAMVGHAIVDGEPVVRLVFLDPTLNPSDIDTFFSEVLTVARALRAAAPGEGSP
ncbi:MAG: aminotransferase class V-fold PLP-dependent enzyme [Deltaproteobacteria bacterium]|nr:MAG: aminotransferase class V-fold PLP-dependent enzyme [Deltaproteobacteria bacterium]